MTTWSVRKIFLLLPVRPVALCAQHRVRLERLLGAITIRPRIKVTTRRDEASLIYSIIFSGAMPRGKKFNFSIALVPSKSKIRVLLDVGCGIGVFLEEAKKQKWTVFGVEISENARKQAEKRINQLVFEKIEDLPVEQKFDGISLFHVLEHLPDPVHTLKVLHERAQPGAALVLALPNPKSWDAEHYGVHWAAWDVPIHFWHFTKEDVNRLATKTGWQLESIRPMQLDAYYVGLLSESFQHGSKRWIAATWKGFWSNIRGGRENTSSLMYVLRKPS